LITSTKKRLDRKPTLTDYFLIYDFCIRLFESMWHSILNESVYGSLDVYLRKQKELSEQADAILQGNKSRRRKKT
jgi:hypothetical protein